MEITILSALGGRASGYITFHVPPNYAIGHLLKLYCVEKGIDVADDYVLCGKGNVILDPLKTLEEEGIHNTDCIKFTQNDKQEQLFAFGSWWIITLLAFIIFGVGLAYSFYLFYSHQAVPQKYGLVIDAGSTHSQLFVFSWSKFEKHGSANVKLIHDCIMPGGVANFKSHIKDLHQYFSPCINEAEEIIPVSSIPHTPLILAATGGMRILRAYDPEGANLVLSAIREIFWLKTKFLTRRKDVFVTSGQQEGISGWAALNYLMENFQETDSDSEKVSEKNAQVSALDLGGASVQVTTELSKHASQWPTVNISIFNNTYRIFSRSFLCCGVEEAMHRYQYLLVRNLKNESSSVILNPCLPRGFEMSFTSGDFFKPCIFSTKTKIPPSTSFQSKYLKKFAFKYITESPTSSKEDSTTDTYSNDTSSSVSEEEKTVYLLKGSSDTKLCRRKVESLFNYELCKKNFVIGDCLNKKFVPLYKGELVGFSSIFPKLFPLLGVSQEGTFKDFKNAVISTCSLSAEDLINSHPNVSRLILEDLCFDGMYVYTLLREGLGVTSQTWKSILFTNKVHEQDIVWTMGLMLNRTSFLKQQNSVSGISMTNFSLLLLLVSSFLIISLIFLWYTFKMKRRGNVYQRVFTSVLDP